MKRFIVLLMLASASLALLFSCGKEDAGSAGKQSGEPSARTLKLNADPVKYNVSNAGTETFDWEQGDRVRVFAFKKPVSIGESHFVDLGSFEVSVNAGKAVFSSSVGAFDPDAMQIYAVYPDRDDITFSTVSESQYYSLGVTIDPVQSGDARKHCVLVSNDAILFSSTSVIKQPSFKLVTPIMRFSVQSDKDIASIRIACNDYFAGRGFPTRTNQVALAGGAGTNKITLKNASVIASAGKTDLSFACSPLALGKKLAFTFTASDGTVSQAEWICSKATSVGYAYDMGTLTASGWVSAVPAGKEAEKASAAVKNMGLGVNICNSFEIGVNWQQKGASRQYPKSFECLNARTATTQATMDALAKAGFKTVRLPVTWYHHMDNVLTGKIDKVWLDRIAEVAGYAFKNGMYVIINVHHDTGPSATPWFIANYKNYNDMSAKFRNVWTQIAEYFKDFDDHLLFEGYNEMLDAQNKWDYPSDNSSFTAANLFNQEFVDIVRSTGSCNATRNLIVSTYATSTSRKALEGFLMPDDEVEGHLMVQIHSYIPTGFTTAEQGKMTYQFKDSDIPEIDNMFKGVKECILDKGYPCVLGEYGSFPTALRPDTERGRHAAVFTRKALELGIAPVYWYTPTDYSQREYGYWTYPAVKDSLVKAYNEFIQHTYNN